MIVSLLQATATCLLLPVAALAAEPAEYAIRWSDGGPANAHAVIRLLRLEGKLKVNTFSIQYFQFAASTPGTNDFSIGRVRTRSDGKVELSYKTRQDISAKRNPWICPLDGAVSKAEVDVTLRKNDVIRKFSQSCELEARHALSFPSSLLATPKGCTNQMMRTEIGKVKIEEWTTQRGRLIEVSMVGTTSEADLITFRKMAEPLLKSGVAPLDRSKTEIGADC